MIFPTRHALTVSDFYLKTFPFYQNVELFAENNNDPKFASRDKIYFPFRANQVSREENAEQENSHKSLWKWTER